MSINPSSVNSQPRHDTRGTKRQQYVYTQPQETPSTHCNQNIMKRRGLVSTPNKTPWKQRILGRQGRRTSNHGNHGNHGNQSASDQRGRPEARRQTARRKQGIGKAGSARTRDQILSMVRMVTGDTPRSLIFLPHIDQLRNALLHNVGLNQIHAYFPFFKKLI